MRVFVSGKIGSEDDIEGFMKEIEAAGHTITFNWTEIPHLKPYDEHKKESRQAAIEEIKGVYTADVLVMLVHDRGVGMFVELGAALSNGIPVIAVFSGEPRSMFFYHPAVKVVEDKKDVFYLLEQMEYGLGNDI